MQHFPLIFRSEKQIISAKGSVNVENYPYPPETDPKQAQQLQDPLMNSGSAGDCTGLIPSMPEDGEELDSYAELYRFLPPEPGEKR